MKSLLESKEYQLLISDIKDINLKINSVESNLETQQLKERLNELLELKYMYDNIKHVIHTFNDIE